MKFGSGTDNYGNLTVNRLTIKDNAGRLETFDNATLECVYILGDKFYQITHSSGEILCNPGNIVFMQMK